MSLLASVSAHDLGFIDSDALVERIEATLTTIDRLEHFEGHLLNWYDTQSLMPLLPKYVSTVDSGNYAAALLTVSAAPARARRVAGRRRRRQVAGGADDRPCRSRQCLLRRNAFRIPLRQEAPALRDRLPPRRSIRRRAARLVLLRSARLRSAPGELHCDRQGRRARAPLVPPRPPDHQRARITGAAVVERDDVRVPDAAAGDAELSGNPARRVVPHGGAAADRLRPHARHAVGHLRVCLYRRRSRR